MLQRTAGNQAVLRLLGRSAGSPALPAVQRKPRVGPADDRYEQQADAVATQVQTSHPARDGQAAPAAGRIQRWAAVGPEGGQIDDALEQRIRRAQNGGGSLPASVRRTLEPKLGADLSPVRVHTDGNAIQLAHELGAKAFTHQNHIFYGAGQSPHDLALTAHESIHTIQQGAVQRSGAYPRGADAKAPEADLQMMPNTRPGVIQRTPAMVRSPVTARVWLGKLDGLSPEAKIKAVSGGSKGRKYEKLQTVELEDDEALHIKDKDGNIVWYRIKNASAFIPTSKVLTGIDPSRGKAEEPELKGEDASSLVKAAGSLPSSVDNDLIEAQQWYFKKEEREGLTEKEQTAYDRTNLSEAAMWIGGSALGFASGIMGMAAALKDLADNEKGAWDKVNAAFEYTGATLETIGGAVGTMGGISAYVNMGAEEGTKVADDSEAVSGWGFGYQAMLGTLSSGIKTIKSVVDLVHMIYEEKKGAAVHDRDAYISTVSDLLTGALDTARGVLSSIRQVTQLVTGGIMDVFDNVIPGLDIATAAVNIIFEGYYLIESAVHHWWMRTRRKKLLAELKQKGYDKAQVKEAQKYYTTHEAKIANLGGLKEKNVKSKADADKKSDKTTKSADRVALYSKGLVLEAENRDLTKQQETAEEEMAQYETAHHPSRAELSEYSLAGELKSANRKRIVRQSLHIGTNLMKIAGSITALVAGPGAPAGIGVKAAAAGIDVSLPFFRSLKQWGHNQAAKRQAKGQTGKVTKAFSKIFNAYKSTVAILTSRKKHAVKLLLLVAGLNRHLPLGQDAAKKKALAADIRTVERYIRAAGCSPVRLYKANGNPAAQIKILVEALSKRELS
jgi:hypothetical protein